MENYRQKTRELYEKYARKFQERTEGYLGKYLLNDAKLFIRNLDGVDILDIGSGPGRDSSYFKAQGLNPLCIDISQTMVDICRERGLQAVVMDVEALGFQDGSFDGVWAHTSLLHVPKKKLCLIIKIISDILRERGVFYIGMKEGDYDGMEVDPKYSGAQRYSALYSEEEIKMKIEGQFTILHHSRIEPGENQAYFNYLCRKKE